MTAVNTFTNTPGPTIDVGSYPTAIAITPNGATAYVVNSGAGVQTGSVTPINLSTNTAGPAIQGHLPPNEAAIAISPNGATAYVVGSNGIGGGLISTIDTATETVGPEFGVGDDLQAIAITPNGATAYVVAGIGAEPVNLSTNTPGSVIESGLDPVAIAITPNGAIAYVVNECGSNPASNCNGDSTVTPIDTATNAAGPMIDVGSSAGAIAIG